MSRVGVSAMISIFVVFTGACEDGDPSFDQESSAVTSGDAPAGPGGGSGATSAAAPLGICQDGASQSAAALNDAVARADVACARDEDCAVVWPATSCHASCWAVVSQLGAQQIEQQSQLLSAGCATFEALACVRAVPSCDEAGAAACVAGTCRALNRLDAITP